MNKTFYMFFQQYENAIKTTRKKLCRENEGKLPYQHNNLDQEGVEGEMREENT